MTLIVIVIPKLNSGQALTNPPAGGQNQKLKFKSRAKKFLTFDLQF